MNSALIVAAMSLLALVIRQILPWRKQKQDVAEHLRDNLLHRVEKLERQLERERMRHNSERALDRHRLNNVTQCFDAMLMLIEMNPEKAKDVVVKIKEMRAAQVMAEAEEKSIIRAAEMIADEKESGYDDL